MNWAVRAALVRGKWPEPAKEGAQRSGHGFGSVSRMYGKSGRLARLVGPKASDAVGSMQAGSGSSHRSEHRHGTLQASPRARRDAFPARDASLTPTQAPIGPPAPRSWGKETGVRVKATLTSFKLHALDRTNRDMAAAKSALSVLVSEDNCRNGLLAGVIFGARAYRPCVARFSK